MSDINKKDLYNWCKIPVSELENHPDLKIPFCLTKDSDEMGEVMAGEFVAEIKLANANGQAFRAIVPCGPKCWYAPFTRMVNEEKVSLGNLTVFHMDECLDWEGNLLAKNDPYNFRTFMEQHFYGGIRTDLAVPEKQRIFPEPNRTMDIKWIPVLIILLLPCINIAPRTIKNILFLFFAQAQTLHVLFK